MEFSEGSKNSSQPLRILTDMVGSYSAILTWLSFAPCLLLRSWLGSWLCSFAPGFAIRSLTYAVLLAISAILWPARGLRSLLMWVACWRTLLLTDMVGSCSAILTWCPSLLAVFRPWLAPSLLAWLLALLFRPWLAPLLLAWLLALLFRSWLCYSLFDLCGFAFHH
ncbi:MAG: hypothetical protein K6U11_03130 [bacterium]|nr:hypothetical protein [bacterium]